MITSVLKEGIKISVLATDRSISVKKQIAGELIQNLIIIIYFWNIIFNLWKFQPMCSELNAKLGEFRFEHVFDVWHWIHNVMKDLR